MLDRILEEVSDFRKHVSNVYKHIFIYLSFSIYQLFSDDYQK